MMRVYRVLPPAPREVRPATSPAAPVTPTARQRLACPRLAPASCVLTAAVRLQSTAIPGAVIETSALLHARRPCCVIICVVVLQGRLKNPRRARGARRSALASSGKRRTGSGVPA
jgi:hypothetical protein